MTREEAKEVFLNRGFIDGIYNGDKWREACIVISKWLEQEPRKGHWITRPHVYGVTYCSECDFELKIDDTNYCPNCGADMGGNRKRKGESIEGNNESYICENWIP